MFRSAAQVAAAVVTAAIAAAAAPAPASSGLPLAPLRFLQTVGGFDAAAIARLDGGETITAILETDKREVAVVGAVRVRAPVDRLLDRVRDVDSLERSDLVLRVGRVGTPARAEDFAPLAFEPYDLDAVRSCKPGDCAVRLPAQAWPRFQRDVNWGASGWRDQAAAVWRRVLADYTETYRTRGATALAEYHNKAVPVSVADEFDVLLNASRAFEPSAPAFFEHVRAFPASAPPGVEDVFYWSKTDFGIRPVVAVTHLSLYRVPVVSPMQRTSAVIASKQIYATHYFDAALTLTLAYDDGEGGFYMVSVNRARTRSLAGWTRAMVRSVVQKRSREGLEKTLRATKAALER